MTDDEEIKSLMSEKVSAYEENTMMGKTTERIIRIKMNLKIFLKRIVMEIAVAMIVVMMYHCG